MTEEEQLARAREAQRILENPLVVEAFITLEETFVSAWRGSDPSDAQGREELHRTLRLLDLFKGQLTAVLNTGMLAERAAADRESVAEAARVEEEWDPRS